ncbi:PBECR4 domain-containing protein [Lactobacillus sp. ESL0684]|uniref:PBECR4 domain-containing protein n=1 Tax=Lactobacillus sp. ESL0684 TaxID=2983213 RepID=UPI0023F70F54|nr:PBECR4 domain-containing protein [Lactobacillus sp. ESL0684]WEV43921.1 PBECR4 domain-containing protein [Lactobacillus sp. ESL0684]
MMVEKSEKDLLITAAREYEKLIDKKIKMILGHKGKSESVTILFDASDFHHLAGLHKLTEYRKKPGNQPVFLYNLSQKSCSNVYKCKSCGIINISLQV